MNQKYKIEYNRVIRKDDLIHQLMYEKNYKMRSAKAVVEDFMDMVVANIERGNSVHLSGFGQLEAFEAKGHMTANPSTGAPQELPNHYRIRFKPGERLKRAAKMIQAEEAKKKERQEWATKYGFTRQLHDRDRK